AAYEQQAEADRAAVARAAEYTGDPKQRPPSRADIKNRITDEAGNVHAIADAKDVPVGGYCNVVTLGSYKMVKADASFGAIKAGDLLTTSPNPGYAMKVTDKSQMGGAVIGKALSGLAQGTGTVTVMVTLK